MRLDVEGETPLQAAERVPSVVAAVHEIAPVAEAVYLAAQELALDAGPRWCTVDRPTRPTDEGLAVGAPDPTFEAVIEQRMSKDLAERQRVVYALEAAGEVSGLAEKVEARGFDRLDRNGETHRCLPLATFEFHEEG